MTRILIAVGVALLFTSRAWAQSEANCEEIKQAIATYGYEEARKHALLLKETSANEVATKPAPKHPQAKKHKHAAPSGQAKSAQAQRK